MKVATRLATSSGLVFLLLTAVLAYEVVQVNYLARLSGDLARSGLAAAELSIEQIADLGDLEAAAKKGFVTQDPDYARRARELAERVNGRGGQMATLGLSGEAKVQWERFEARWQPVYAAASGLSFGAPSEEGFLQNLRGVQNQALALAAATRVAIREDAARAESAAREARTLSLAAAFIALLVGAAALALTARSIQRSLAVLAQGTRAVAQGNFDPLIEPGGNDEFASLSADFNLMVRRLGELDQMKKDLLSHVSHELKAPLAAMQETNQILIEGIPGPVTEDQRRLLDLNLQSARRLSALIARLLDLSRMEAGVMEYDLRPHDLNVILRGACDEMQVLAGDKGVGLVPSLPREPLWVNGDADRLHQMATNLLENAIKFSPAGEEVVVSVRLAADLPADAPIHVRERTAWDARLLGAVLLTIADRGPGVPDDQKERIFDRFHQVHHGRGRGGGGVGLGLAICREVVNAHGGGLWVSDNGDRGSVFAVALAPHSPSGPSLTGRDRP